MEERGLIGGEVEVEANIYERGVNQFFMVGGIFMGGEIRRPSSVRVRKWRFIFRASSSI